MDADTASAAPMGHEANLAPMMVFAACMAVVSVAALGMKRAGVVAAYGADVVSVTSSWYIVSISLTLFNKYIFTGLYGGVHFPLLVSLWHMVLKGCVAAVILHVYVAREDLDDGGLVQGNATGSEALPRSRVGNTPLAAGGSVFEFFRDRSYMQMAAPIGICTGLDIGLSNWAIGEYIGVSLYTIVKTSVLVFTYILSVAAQTQPAKATLTLSILMVCFGIAAATAADGAAGGAAGDPSRVMIGVAMTGAASALAATRWVLTEVVLKQHLCTRGTAKGKFQLLMCISPTAAASVAALAVPFELDAFSRSALAADTEKLAVVAGAASAAGVAAIGLIFMEFALVHLASALTLSLAGHLKEILSVVFAVVVFRESCSSLKISGMTLALVGSLVYIHVKASAHKAAELQYTELCDAGESPAALPSARL